MKCSRCGRELKQGELFCANCAEPTASAVNPQIREKPSDIVSCLLVGLFVIAGIPALLLGGFLLALGMGWAGADNAGPRHGAVTLLLSIFPLGVFLALLFLLVRVWAARREGSEP